MNISLFRRNIYNYLYALCDIIYNLGV